MSQNPNWINSDQIYNQSAVIPYRHTPQGIEVMLITSRKRKRWVIPKGIVEQHLSAAESAVQEAWEEAGIRGEVSDRPVGMYRYKKWGGTCRVKVFLLRVKAVIDDWPESTIRSREWLSVPEAAGRVDEADLKQMILSLPEILEVN
jgi:8-oxo-dGTP pyrophosphatase MutT (NUDIX family)